MMSKFFKVIFNFFKKIYGVIDKFIVVPISRLIYRINELLRNNSGKIEKILNRPNVLIYLSLFYAIAIFLLIDTKSISLVSDEAEVLSDQPVNVIYNEEAYVVEGVPDTVDITLIGRKSDLYLAKQLGEHEVVLDLSGYSEGTYKVKLKYNHSIDTVDYKLDPSTISIKISEKVSSIKTLSYDLLNEDKLDSKLSISNVTLDRSEVIVKGSQETLDKIAKVKALIDLKAADLTGKGTFTIDSIVLVAYANDGTVIDNVEIVPAKISASVTVDSYYAELPVKVVTEGTLTSGYAISSVSSSISKVEVYGDEETIKSLSYIEAKINVDGLSSDKTYNVSLTKPSGVKYLSDSNVSVSIKLEAETSKEISGVVIKPINLGDKLKASAASLDDQTITVIAKGVESTLSSLEAKDFVATVDLSGYTSGTYDVDVVVTTSDIRVSVIPKVSTIKVKIISE
jgi:YbbR domain-containing protein